MLGEHTSSLDTLKQSVLLLCLEEEKKVLDEKRNIMFENRLGKETIIKNGNGSIQKVEIRQIQESWDAKKILTIDQSKENFGKPKFDKIKTCNQITTSNALKVTLSDGKSLICSNGQLVPICEFVGGNFSKNFEINEFKAGELKKGDEMLGTR